MDSGNGKLDSWRRWVFLATFVNYALSHWTRKCYTNVKLQMMGTGVDALVLASMDSAFMFTYAGGSFITGALGDRFSPTAVVGIGLVGSTLCLVSMVLGVSTGIATSATLAAGWFVSTQAVHGLFQATGGPVNTAIMGSWFPKKDRGFIFGLWTCHQYVGDIVAAFAGAIILSSPLNWRYAIIIPLVVNGIWGVVNFLVVPNRPADVGIETEESRARVAKAEASGQDPAELPPPIPISKAVMIPNVMSYAFAFGFFKLINYAMFFQLPMILSSNFSASTANIISSLYSFGMMPGGIVCGYVSDVYGGRRACVCATMMVILVPLLLFFAYFMDTMPVIPMLVLLAIMGCLVGGPNNIITSAVAADLADDPSIKGNNRALGTVTGIINGSGSVTAALGQMAIPVLYNIGKEDGVNYRYVWLFLVACTVVGTALLGPKIVKELRPADPQADEETQTLLNKSQTAYRTNTANLRV